MSVYFVALRTYYSMDNNTDDCPSCYGRCSCAPGACSCGPDCYCGSCH